MRGVGILVTVLLHIVLKGLCLLAVRRSTVMPHVLGTEDFRIGFNE